MNYHFSMEKGEYQSGGRIFCGSGQVGSKIDIFYHGPGQGKTNRTVNPPSRNYNGDLRRGGGGGTSRGGFPASLRRWWDDMDAGRRIDLGRRGHLGSPGKTGKIGQV